MMRQVFAIPVAAVVLLAVAVGTATATSDSSDEALVSGDNPQAALMMPLSAGQGADIYGVGAGKVSGGIQKFDLSAHQGPDGDFGHVGVTQTDLMGNVLVKYKVDVDCVNIVASGTGPFPAVFDRGIIRGVVKHVTPSPNLFGVDAGETLLFGIKDGGNQSGPVPVDDFYAPNADIFPGISCKFVFYVGNFNNVTQGNVNIKAD